MARALFDLQKILLQMDTTTFFYYFSRPTLKETLTSENNHMVYRPEHLK